MRNKPLDDAIANIASTSQALEKFCNDPKNYNSYATELLEVMSWELYRQSNQLKEIQEIGGY